MKKYSVAYIDCDCDLSHGIIEAENEIVAAAKFVFQYNDDITDEVISEIESIYEIIKMKTGDVLTISVKEII